MLGTIFCGLWLMNMTRGYRLHNQIVSVAEMPYSHESSPDITVEDIYLLEQAGFNAGWEVVAKKAELYDAEQLAVLHQFQARLFGQPIKPLMIATHGQVDRVTGDIAVHGDVRLQYQEGYTIETEALYWYAAERVLYTEAPVQIRNPSISITGMGLYSNVDQHSISLKHSVQASFRLP
jgi:LPS export ABC transporter protein LptC